MAKVDAALAWAARGFRVFPLRVNGTRPVYRNWPADATTDPERIRQWWIEDYNIGMLTDGLMVIDIDTKKPDALENFQKIGGGPDTLTVRTKSGGFHLYYRPPHEIANSQGGTGGMISAIDVRGHHGYVAAPGSTVDGAAYTVANDIPIAPAPANLVALCRQPGERASDTSIPATELDTPAAREAVARYLRDAPPAVEGDSGESRTLMVAMECRDLGVSEPICLDLMLDHYNDRCSPPWDADELAAKVSNAYLYSQNKAGSKAAAVDFDGVVYTPVPVPPAAGASLESPPFKPFAFGTVLPSSRLLAREWIIDRVLERGEITALVAPGGVGKSLAILTTAFHLAIGSDTVFGRRNMFAGVPQRSVIYDAEDGIQEMSKRLAALCQYHGVDESVILERISITSGRGGEFSLQVATGGSVATRTATDDEHLGFLISASIAPDIAMIGLAPLNKMHSANPNDNGQMTVVMRSLEFIASKSEAGVLLGAHTSKPGMSGGSHAGDANSLAGAAAVINSVRIALTLAEPSDEDAARFGLLPDERVRLLRFDDAKLNRGLRSAHPIWVRKESLKLWCDDEMGVFVAADMSDRGDSMREGIAGVLEAEMYRDGVARFTMQQAAAALRRGDPLYGQLESRQITSRIEKALASPIETASGVVVRLLVEGSSKFVVMG